MWQVLQTASGH